MNDLLLPLINFTFSNFRQHANAVGTLSGHASWVLSVAFSQDKNHFVSSSSDNTVKVWELKERQCISTLSVHTDQVSMSLVLNSFENYIYFLKYTGKLYLDTF